MAFGSVSENWRARQNFASAGQKNNPIFRDIRETVTFLDPGFHEMKHEKIDGGMKDRKKTWYNTMWVDKITNALEEVLGVEWMVVA